MKTTPKVRELIAACSQPACRRGAQYRIKKTGRLICMLCAKLLDKDEITQIEEKA